MRFSAKRAMPSVRLAIITVPPGLNHGFRFSRDIDGLVITLLRSHLSHPPGDRSQLGEWLAAPHLTPLDPDRAEAAYVMQTLRRLGDEFENRRSGRNEALAAYVALALRLTARISQEGNTHELPPNENERRMEMLSELIQQHFRSHKPASFYARELGVSPTHLTRIVRSMTGNTPHELIAEANSSKRRNASWFSRSVAFRRSGFGSALPIPPISRASFLNIWEKPRGSGA